MWKLNAGLWRGELGTGDDGMGRDYPRLGPKEFLLAPIVVNKFSVYRIGMFLMNAEGDGELCLEFVSRDGVFFPQIDMRIPAKPMVWQKFEADVTTGRCQPNETVDLRVMKSGLRGAVLICSMEARELPKGNGPTPEPRLVEEVPLWPYGDMETIEDYTLVMEAEMDEFDQQAWRGKGLVAKKDERGAKCVSMEGDGSIVFVPVKVAPNALYRCHVDLRRETGNGKLYANFYANRSFDFPQQALVCETGNWGTYDIQLRTGNFPPNLPIVLRIWRFPKGTGSLLVRRIALERLPEGTREEAPKLIASSSMERLVPVPADPIPIKVPRSRKRPPAPEVLPHRPKHPTVPDHLGFSVFEPEIRGMLMVSEIGDAAAMRDACGAIGLTCDMLALPEGMDRLSDAARSHAWVHFHLRRGTSVTREAIMGIRDKCPGILVTAWAEPGWPLFDAGTMAVLRAADIALFESDLEVSTYRAAGCFNAELWDPGARELALPDAPEGDEVVFVSDDPAEPKENLVETVANRIGRSPRTASADDEGRRHALAAAKVAVFPDHRPSRTLFGLLASGIPVVVQRSLGTMEWCRDGAGLRMFDTPEECASLVDALLTDQETARTLGEAGMELASSHSRTARIMELAARVGCPEAILPALPKGRTHAMERVMCALCAPPASMLSMSQNNGITVVGAQFSECRDLAAKVARFRPDLLHLHLDDKDDGMPWRDLLLDLRRRVPGMLVTAWHRGGSETDRRMMDLRFSVDQLLVGNPEALAPYHSASMVGARFWNPGVSPWDDPDAFREALASFASGLPDWRAAAFTGGDGRTVDLTVFIGTLNRYDALRRAVETALASAGRRAVEVIVNDAGSSDGTQEWLRKVSAGDRRIVPIFSGKRTSFTQAFNEALQIARGRYICWLSDDIVSESTALDDMCAIMDQATPGDMGGFCVRNSWSHEYTVRKDSGFHFPTVGCMYTETLRKMNGINMDYPYYAQDTDLDTRVMRLGGRVIAAVNCRLLHNCMNDILRKSNSDNHVRNMGDAKYILAAWRPGESSWFPYPRILLVPEDGARPETVAKVAKTIKTEYSNSHMFVAGPFPGLDMKGANSFLRMVPADYPRAPFLFDLVVRVGPEGAVLTRPSDRSNTPFVRKMLGT